MRALITSDEVIREYNRINDIDYYDMMEEYEKYDRIIQNQRKDQSELIEKENNTACSFPKYGLSGIDKDKLGRSVEKYYDNPSIMEAQSCALRNYGKVYAIDTFEGRIAKSEAMRDVFEAINQFGDSSVSCMAIKSSFKKENLYVVAKTPRNPDDYNDFIHELFVGRFGTNSTRKYLSNFAYVYGGFKCGEPYIGADGKVLNYCDPEDENQVHYIVYELIEGPSFSKYLETCTVEDYVGAMFQITLAIIRAHREFDFTHYDLHDGNVLMRTLPEETKIVYNVRSSKDNFITVKAKSVATIIDFGRCHIKYKDKSYGYEMITGGTYPDESFPVQDIYKFLLFGVQSMLYYEREDLVKVAQSFFSYFSNENVVDASNRQRDSYYILPKKYINTFNLNDFLQNFTAKNRALCGQIISLESREEIPGDTPILGCSSGSCATEPEVLKDLRASINADSYLDFYDQIIRLKDTVGGQVAIEKLKANFEPNLSKYCDEHIEKSNIIGNQLLEVYYKLAEEGSLGGIDVEKFYSRTYPKIRKRNDDLQRFRYLFLRVVRYIGIARYIENIFHRDCMEDTEMVKKLNEIVDNVNQLIQDFSNVQLVVKRVLERTKKTTLAGAKANYKFYFDEVYLTESETKNYLWLKKDLKPIISLKKFAS